MSLRRNDDRTTELTSSIPAISRRRARATRFGGTRTSIERDIPEPLPDIVLPAIAVPVVRRLLRGGDEGIVEVVGVHL